MSYGMAFCVADVGSSIRMPRDFFISDPAFRRWSSLIEALEERERESHEGNDS